MSSFLDSNFIQQPRGIAPGEASWPRGQQQPLAPVAAPMPQMAPAPSPRQTMKRVPPHIAHGHRSPEEHTNAVMQEIFDNVVPLQALPPHMRLANPNLEGALHGVGKLPQSFAAAFKKAYPTLDPWSINLGGLSEHTRGVLENMISEETARRQAQAAKDVTADRKGGKT